jgi:hypothetical protein
VLEGRAGRTSGCQRQCGCGSMGKASHCLAVTADEAVTNLPPKPRASTAGPWPQLYTLVGKSSECAQGALERGEELIALHAAHLAAHVAKTTKRLPAHQAR